MLRLSGSLALLVVLAVGTGRCDAQALYLTATPTVGYYSAGYYAAPASYGYTATYSASTGGYYGAAPGVSAAPRRVGYAVPTGYYSPRPAAYYAAGVAPAPVAVRTFQYAVTAPAPVATYAVAPAPVVYAPRVVRYPRKAVYVVYP